MTVYKNNRGKWIAHIVWEYPDGSSTEVKKTSPYQSKPGAERYEREIRDALQKGTYGKHNGDVPTLDEYKDTYLSKCESKRQSPGGVNNKKTIFNAHLVPLFGDRRMDSFKLKDEDALQERLVQHSASRYNQAASCINATIKMFHARYELSGVPFKFCRLKPVDPTKGFYSFDEYAAFKEAAASICIVSELVAALGGEAGVRRGEMWALRPTDCYGSHIMIERSEAIIGKERFMGPTKSKKSRKVETTDYLQDVIRRHKAKYGRRELMVVREDGAPFNQNTFKTLIKNIQRKAGLPVTGEVHILRHTFCSHLAMLGVPVKVIQELAGHANLATTLVYMHLAPGNTAQGIARLAEGRSNSRGNLTATAAE